MTLQERREQLEAAFNQVQQDLAVLTERRFQLTGALMLLRELEAEAQQADSPT